MSSYARGMVLAERLRAAGIDATCDPRSATPPCVLIHPPALDYRLGGMCTPLATWELFALSPATGNADAWKALDELVDQVADLLPVEQLAWVAYQRSADSPVVPAYRITFTQGLDVTE